MTGSPTAGPPFSDLDDAETAAAPLPLSGRETKRLELVRTLIAVARHLKAPPHIDHAQAIVDLVARHRPPVRHALPADPPALTGLSAERARERAMQGCAAVFLDRLLPAAREHAITYASAVAHGDGNPPEGEEDGRSALEAADALATVVRALHGAGRQNIDAVSDAVEALARATVADLLERSTVLDIPIPTDTLTQALLRLERINALLKPLAAGSSTIRDLVFYSRLVSRLALRQGATILNGFVHDGTPETLHRSMALAATVDSVILIAMRLLDSVADEREDPQTPFVRRVDEVAFENFSEAAKRLGTALVGLLDRLMEMPGRSDRLFVALTKQVKWLHRYCVGVARGDPPPELAELADYLVLQSARLCRRVTAQMTDGACAETADAAALRSLIMRGEAFDTLLADMNRIHLRNDLVGVLELLRRKAETPPA